jgi:prepilin-type N-terminal cleavage/methylation domain-containing protein
MKQTSERGFTLVEIMIVVAIIALLAAIAIPNVLRGRTSANEAAAVGNLRALISSLEMARSVNNSYPTPAGTWLTTMYGAGAAPAACAAGVAPDPDFGPPSFCNAMGGNTVQGYNYTYAGVAAGTTYTLLAVPTTIGNTGTRTFFANETGLLRHCVSPPAGTVANGPTWATIDQPPTNPCT